jgi:hypothetical protein
LALAGQAEQVQIHNRGEADYKDKLLSLARSLLVAVVAVGVK